MKKILKTFLFFTCLSVIALKTQIAYAQSDVKIKTTMLDAYRAYKELQPYLYDHAEFAKPSNQQKIEKQIKKLINDFHTKENFSDRYRNKPGFAANLKQTSELLKDADLRFNEGKKSYALWRLRSLSENCITCHTSYEVNVKFSPNEELGKNYDAYTKGEFYLSTRQYEKAREYFLKAATAESDKYSSFDALKRWLLVTTRVLTNSNVAKKELLRALKNHSWTLYEKSQINNWLKSINNWRKDEHKQTVELSYAKALIAKAMVRNDPLDLDVDDAGLLRATGILHKLLDGSNYGTLERKEALYLLGLAYSKLPLFFVNGMAASLLEQCILEFPGSKEAIKSYQIYRNIIEFENLGNSNRRLSNDVKLRLKEFYDIAHSSDKLLGIM